VAVDQAGNVVTSTDPTAGAGAWTLTHVDSQGLSAISCPSNGLCVAVDGENVVTSTDPTGGAAAWTLTHVGAAHGVSCPSVSFCVTVAREGIVNTSTDPTGGESAWSVTHVKGLLSLSEVSCASESLCVATPEELSFFSRDVLASTDPAGGATAWTEENVYGETTYEQTSGIEPDEIIVDRGLAGVSCAAEGVCVAADISSREITGTLTPPKPEPPVIDSESVSNLTEHDATLQAQITPGAHGAYYQFQVVSEPGEYRSEIACPLRDELKATDGCQGPEVKGATVSYVPGGSTAQSVSLDLTSIGMTLQPGTTYHYRVLVATRIQTEDTTQWETPPTYGADQTFTTQEEPRTTGQGALTGSETFSGGSGNFSPLPPIVVKPKTPAQLKAAKLAKALKTCKKDRSKRKRASCEKQARKKYGASVHRG
jgi:hypothetical protein